MLKKAVKKYVDDLEKNELINQFASQGLIYPDSDQVISILSKKVLYQLYSQSPGGQCYSPTR